MTFAYPPINLVAILVAAVAQFVLGWSWHSSASPTGKRWMAEMGVTTMPAPSWFLGWAEPRRRFGKRRDR